MYDVYYISSHPLMEAYECNPLAIRVFHNFGLEGLTLMRVGSVVFLMMMILLLYHINGFKRKAYYVSLAVAVFHFFFLIYISVDWDALIGRFYK